MATDHNGKFFFWRVVDGVAIPEYSAAAADADPSNVYGSIEGAIINGGVQATAFYRRYERIYDAMAWLERRERVAAGTVCITKITAEPK